MVNETITPVKETPAPATTEAKPEAPRGDVNNFNCLYEMFNANKTPKVEDIFSKIWRYATEKAENKDFDSVKWEVIRLKNRLGSAHLGEAPYAKVERYVTAYYDLKKAEERVKEIENA